MVLIKNGESVSDPWIFLSDEEAAPREGALAVSLARWQVERESLKARSSPLGVVLKGEELADALADDLQHLDLVVVTFAKFNDGRAFSTARRLRQTFGFKGEIRATGHLIQDQFLFLKRCGVDAVELQGETQARAWQEAMGEIENFYQPALDESTAIPHLRRIALRQDQARNRL